jgi:hypothetical protein
MKSRNKLDMKGIVVTIDRADGTNRERMHQLFKEVRAAHTVEDDFTA